MEETSFVVYEGVVVPESVLVKRQRKNPYGSVEGLDDDELADPDELERQAYQEMFAPILKIPRVRRSWIEPVVEENGHVHFGAFSTVDFERNMPGFDKARYKAEKLREELKDLLLLIDISKEHVPCNAKYLVLKYLRLGVIDIDHIENVDMLVLAQQYLRARRLQKEIRELEERRWRRQREREEAWLRG